MMTTNKIPRKDLISLIQDISWFSKFDCKSGFWQIKMAEESIQWMAFSVPQGKIRMACYAIWIQKCPSYLPKKNG